MIAPSPAVLPRDILDFLVEGCQVLAPDWTYVYLNLAAAAQGKRDRDDLIGRSIVAEFPGIDQTELFAAMQRCMTQRTREQFEHEFHYPDHSTGWFELRLEPVPQGIFVLSVDITARKRAEEERAQLEADLRQAQKMETIGRLAGGIAHDFNNILAVISGHADLASSSAEPADPIQQDLASIKEASARAAGLIRQLLTFSRKQVVVTDVVDPNHVVRELEPMLRRLIDADVELRVELAPDAGCVRSDPRQLEQVLMNLAVNARDAMPHGGLLDISTARVDFATSRKGHRITIPPGKYVAITVTDSGLGMDDETLTRLFEPFFTTKLAGKGTGLGLATVYGIVRQTGGEIDVRSALEQGSSFIMYLPREAELPRRIPVIPDPSAHRGKGELILVVEDEEAVRRMTARILTDAGYSVVTAADGHEALVAGAKHSNTLRVVVTDVIMPHMRGTELVTQLRPLLPDIGVVLMSGYTDGALPNVGAGDPSVAFLGKPFQALTLVRIVRELLDRSS